MTHGSSRLLVLASNTNAVCWHNVQHRALNKSVSELMLSLVPEWPQNVPGTQDVSFMVSQKSGSSVFMGILFLRILGSQRWKLNLFLFWFTPDP